MNTAADSIEFQRRIREQVLDRVRGKWYHSIRLHDGTVIPGLIPVEALESRIRSFPIPDDLRGKRVLDVGAATGWCSFEMERRGAHVVAVDCVEYEEFLLASQLLGSKVDYRILDMEEVTADRLGVFDHVLFFGVLYHLRHPLLGLERICALTRDTAFIESFVTNPQDAADPTAQSPALEFYERAELGGQIDNWCGPNLSALSALCRSAGFATATLEYVVEHRAGITCRRRWPDAPPAGSQTPLKLRSAVNNRTHDIHFSSWKDEYVCLYFDCDQSLTLDDIRITVGNFGVPALALHQQPRPNAWQSSFHLPPGLSPGRHAVRISTSRTLPSEAFFIEVDSPAGNTRESAVFPAEDKATAPAPRLVRVENTFSAVPVFRGYPTEHICCLFQTSETGLTKHSVLVEIGGHTMPPVFVTELENEEWQANARMPEGLVDGNYPVRVRTIDSAFSPPATIRVERV